MESSLDVLVQKQTELMKAFGIDFASLETLKSAAMGLVCEAAEVLDNLNDATRPWTTINLAEVQKEAVDVLFYLMEIFILMGWSASDVMVAYEKKHRLNLVRAATRTDKPVMEA